MLGNTDHFGTIAFGIILFLLIHIHVIRCFDPCESGPCQNDGTCIVDTQTVPWDEFAPGPRSNNMGLPLCMQKRLARCELYRGC
ncbi:hypothetical protein AHF37_10237 [Paragonimus kellicotti]|nr:hypothetical protein AHF37_10237 [Paragonimus kellicotti]